MDVNVSEEDMSELHDQNVKTLVSLIECAQGLMRVPELVSMLTVHDDVEASVPCRRVKSRGRNESKK